MGEVLDFVSVYSCRRGSGRKAGIYRGVDCIVDRHRRTDQCSRKATNVDCCGFSLE